MSKQKLKPLWEYRTVYCESAMVASDSPSMSDADMNFAACYGWRVLAATPASGEPGLWQQVLFARSMGTAAFYSGRRAPTGKDLTRLIELGLVDPPTAKKKKKSRLRK